MITITITDEKLQEAFQKSLDEMLSPGNYSNPVKRTLDNILGYSGTLSGELGSQIKSFTEKSLSDPLFQHQLGQAIATEMAKRAVDAMEKKK